MPRSASGSEDLSPAEPGTQIFVEGGQADLLLTPPASPGEGHVEVQAGTLRKKIPRSCPSCAP